MLMDGSAENFCKHTSPAKKARMKENIVVPLFVVIAVKVTHFVDDQADLRHCNDECQLKSATIAHKAQSGE